ncbi:hypothetical protein P691DRAFT_807875, partial [Macrolepiota fuliginosa MF-IS2]
MMAKSSTARSKLDLPLPLVEPQPCFLKPSIWWKSPEEHIREDHHTSRVHQLLLPHLQYGTSLRQPPPGHVRLLFWWSLNELKASRPKAQMSADIPLEPGGSLDLLRVQKMWGLESVTIIHPLRWKIFIPGDPNRLSALAVRDLSIDRHIFITEHPATRQTMVKRVVRLFCLDLYFLSLFGLYRLFVCGGYGPGQCVPVPAWYDHMVMLRNRVAHRLVDLKREIDAMYERVLSYGAWLGISDAVSQRYYQDAEGTLATSWLDYLEERRRNFAKDWGAIVLACLVLCFIWLIDQFVIHVF